MTERMSDAGLIGRSLGKTPPDALRIALTRFTNKYHTTGTPVDLPWREWCAARVAEGAIPAAGIGDVEERKGRLPVEVGAVLTDGRRKTTHARRITWIFFDVDSGSVGWERLHDALREADLAHLVCDSSTHGVAKNGGAPGVRWHCFVPLDPPVAVPEGQEQRFADECWHPQYAHVRGVLQRLAGVGAADKSVDDLAQPVYVARVPPGGGVRRVAWHAGRGLDWGAILEASDYEPPRARGAESARATGGAPPVGEAPTEGTEGLGRRIWRAVQALRGLGVDLKPTPAEGKIWVLCPWRGEHTTGDQRRDVVNSEAAIWVEGTGGFHCQHDHCRERNAGHFLRWAERQGVPRELIDEPAPSASGALADMSAVLAAVERSDLAHALVDDCGLPWKSPDPLLSGASRESSSWRSCWAGGDRAPRHEYVHGAPATPSDSIVACAAGVSALAGASPIPRVVLCRDLADLAVLVAIRGRMKEGREAGKWKDPDAVETFPVLCGDPGVLQIVLGPRLTYGARVVLVGYSARSIERVAPSCDLWILSSPSEAILRGEAHAVDAARRMRRVGEAPRGLLRPEAFKGFYEFNAIGLAKRFRDAFGDRVRRETESEKWKVWAPVGEAGAAWVDDHHASVGGMAQVVLTQGMRAEAERMSDPEVAAAHEAFRLKMISRGHRAMLADAAEEDADTGLRLTVPAGNFDADPMLLNTEGGVVDLATGRVRPPDPALLMTKVARVAPDDSATCPTWERLLRDWLRVKQDGPPDEPLIRYVQALCGYLMTGDVSAQKLWLFTGDGANGKSTFCNVVQAILGDYALQIDPGILLETRADKGSPSSMSRKAVLRGVRAAFASETGVGAKLSSADAKQLASDERIQAKFMGKDFFSFMPTHKLVMLTNHEPPTDDTGDGAIRRLVFVRWCHQIAPEKRVAGLDRTLVAREAAGIFRWMLRGVELWRAGALRDENEPEAIRTKRADYRASNDAFGAFFADCLARDPQGFTPTGMVNALYREWYVARFGEPPRSMALPTRMLKAQGFAESKSYVNKKQTRGYGGIRVQPDSEYHARAQENYNRTRGE